MWKKVRIFSIIFLLFFSLIKSNAQVTWEKKLKKVEEIYSAYEDKEKISVISIVIHGDSVEYINLFGKIGQRKHLDKELYSIGKLTKFFTGIAILKLSEEGKIGLNDHISKYIPDLPDYADSITILNLLCHQSGLNKFNKIKVSGEDQITKYLRNAKLIEKPGIVTIFNNADYYLLSIIIEKVTGKDYSKYMERLIFRKNGVKNVYVANNKIEKKEVDIQAFYTNKTGETEAFKQEWENIKGASGIFMSANDISRFILELNSGNIINPDYLNVYVNGYFEAEKMNLRSVYGLGGNKQSVYGTDYVYESGFDSFGMASFLRIPSDNITVIILTNEISFYKLRRLTILTSNVFTRKYLYPGE